ncbi:hypothetical protein HG535_0A09190 [Zygotorulaspora mrakii]|uniref:Uncharacterized protein n=1 Tax=Zygotorulaspora mrakii TaxID=42260 RepID=A0A7H9AYW2_ZYGMR|nr:uncharacterized protein HG535_0A09190 [Zygotorulaspora mrakii]QLG70969.1 hypothetical protein HG535_0A09190 [Zygotorulaspora mrakii]
MGGIKGFKEEGFEIAEVEEVSSKSIENVFPTHQPDDLVSANVREICERYELPEYKDILERGALLANRPEIFESDENSEAEKRLSGEKHTHLLLSILRSKILAVICTSHTI